MGRLHGITVTLYNQTAVSTDPFGAPVYAETAVDVQNVLVGQPTTDDITDATQIYGKVIRYMLGIPKGDTHDWVNKKVSWTDTYGIQHTVKTFGFPITGIENLIPGDWHMKVRCEEYAG